MTRIEKAVALLNSELEELEHSLSDSDRREFERIVKELRELEDNL
jgi:hypothetical protein